MKRYVLLIEIQNHMAEYSLPAYDNRKGSLDVYRETGIPGVQLRYEVRDGVWYLGSGAKVRLSSGHQELNMEPLSNGMTIRGKLNDNGLRFLITVHEADAEFSRFNKYDISRTDTILIGRRSDASIQIRNVYVSDVQAVLKRKGGKWYVQDFSRNGMYLNQERMEGMKELKAGDRLSFLGYRLLFLGDILAINQTGSIRVQFPMADFGRLGSSRMYKERPLFSRAPRRIEPLDEECIELELPPAAMERKKQPLLLLLGPSLTMPLPVLATVLFNAMLLRRSGASSSPSMYFGMVLSVAMFAGLGVLWSLVRNKYEREEAEQEQEKRHAAYEAYIVGNVRLLEQKRQKNQEILMRSWKSTRELMRELSADRTWMWNRYVNHGDFLTVRLGIGRVLSPNEIKVPEKRFQVVQDAMAAWPYEIQEKYCYLEQSVKLLEIARHRMIGVVGERERTLPVYASIILQLALLHAYTDVKMAFLLGKEDRELEWVRWLPHTLDEDGKFRLVANDAASARNVLYALSAKLQGRQEARKREDGEGTGSWPVYVVFCTDIKLLEQEAVYWYMTEQEGDGFHFVLLCRNMNTLPNACRMIVESSKAFSGAYLLDESYSLDNVIRYDALEMREAEYLAREMCGCRISEYSLGAVPDMVDFMSSLGVKSLSEWNLKQHYKENRAYEGISAWIGVGNRGQDLYLDMHEKRHGPHGLVAGTTGAGKSELLQTMVLSLVMNYSPEEVAVILIDFKGGGMANAFQGIPHLAGTLTNLGEQTGEEDTAGNYNQMRRALISLRSEIRRRQRIFSRYKVNHLDLYMRLYREGKAEAAIPHLLIISDEFAELKKEQPEFIRELVSTARVGRSLGIHLILATQKPSGVVDEEIWSNSRFKLCLRVQDRQDSMEMLKRPEAAFLTKTGRAYLQIGNNERFELFQSGYSGAEYQSELGEDELEGVSLIEIDGSQGVIHQKAESRKGMSQLEACVQYVIQTAEKEQIQRTSGLWLPVLEANLWLEDLMKSVTERDGMYAVFGMADDPEYQRQYPAVWRADEGKNLVIAGDGGSGRTTFLETLLLSMLMRYDADRLNYYILDFSSRTFQNFADSGACGGVFFAEEADKMERLFLLLQDLMKERQELFGQKMAAGFEEYLGMGGQLPRILVFIDNYPVFTELYAAKEEQFLKLSRDGGKYGIQFILTVNRMSDLRYKLRQNFRDRVALLLPDAGEYAEVLGRRPDFHPIGYKGRGLLGEERILEFQTALPVHETGGAGKQKAIKACMLSGGKPARRIRVLPEKQKYGEFFEEFQEREGFRIPIGYEIQEAEPVYLNAAEVFCWAVSAVQQRSIHLAMQNMEYAAGQKGWEVIRVREQEIFEVLVRLKEEFRQRAALKKEMGEAGVQEQVQAVLDTYGMLMVLIEDFDGFLNRIYSNTEREAMYPIAELFFEKEKDCGVIFIGGFEMEQAGMRRYSTACRNFLSEGTGIHLGGMLDRQNLLDVKAGAAARVSESAWNRGYMRCENRTLEVFLPEEEEN